MTGRCFTTTDLDTGDLRAIRYPCMEDPNEGGGGGIAWPIGLTCSRQGIGASALARRSKYPIGDLSSV